MSDKMPTQEERAMAEYMGLKVQPPPKRNDHPSAHDLVADMLTERFDPRDGSDGLTLTNLRAMLDDLLEMYTVLSGGANEAIEEILRRKAFGLKKYGTPLQPFNGRDAVADANDELGDLLVYMAVAIYERGSCV